VAAVRIELLYFAGARDAVGRPSEAVDVAPGTTVATLHDVLLARHPNLVRAGRVRFAVGERFAVPTTPLAEGDVVAIIPPVSGG
jgi:molybdopterin synthase catalytic subunit